MPKTTVILLSALLTLAATFCAAAPPKDNSPGILTGRDKAKAAKNEESRSIDLRNLGPWTNPFSEHPLFRAVVEQWSVTAEDSDAKQALIVKTTLKRSTDHPFTLGADWSATVPTDELSLDVRNLGSRAVKVGVVLVIEGDERINSPFQVIEPGGKHTLQFDMLEKGQA